MTRTAIFFHYFEHNQIYRDNLVFFLSVAYRRDVDFFVIISGSCSVALPDMGNVTYMHTENKNNDYGGYVYALEQLGDTIDNYGYFIFINSSVRGPFCSTRHGKHWVDRFLDKLSAETHLVGSSINVLPNTSRFTQAFNKRFGYPQPYSHVQTTAYALTHSALRHLLGIGFFDIHTRMSKDDVICMYELRLSQEIKKAGWNMKSCLSKYNEIDYRFKHDDINFSSANGDPLYRGGYFGKTPTPNELVFVKTNRDLLYSSELCYHTLVALLSVTNPDIRGWREYRKLTRASFFKLFAAPWRDLKTICLKRMKSIGN